MKNNILTIGLVFGGASGEHEVSIRSAKTIFNALTDEKNKEKYKVICLYIDKQGSWYSSEHADFVLRQGESAHEDKNIDSRSSSRVNKLSTLCFEIYFINASTEPVTAHRKVLSKKPTSLTFSISEISCIVPLSILALSENLISILLIAFARSAVRVLITTILPSRMIATRSANRSTSGNT